MNLVLQRQDTSIRRDCLQIRYVFILLQIILSGLFLHKVLLRNMVSSSRCGCNSRLIIKFFRLKINVIIANLFE